VNRAWWVHEPTATIWETILESGLSAPSRARRELAVHLDGALTEVRKSDLLLLADELVTNSVLHAGSDGPGEILLELVLGRDAVRVVVTDGGSSSVPSLRPRHARPGGRGLYLVERLSDRWGMERDGTSQTRVWFEILRGPAAPPAAATA
jgi:anti-sigma regulatory factor (Ser/Thr protein kinase)